MVPHRTSIIKWHLTCMNVLLLVGCGVEAPSNGHWDRLIWYRWIYFWKGFVESSECVALCRQNYTNSRCRSKRLVQKLNKKFSLTSDGRLNFGFILLESHVGFTLNFTNDKLLFISLLFSLLFSFFTFFFLYFFLSLLFSFFTFFFPYFFLSLLFSFFTFSFFTFFFLYFFLSLLFSYFTFFFPYFFLSLLFYFLTFFPYLCTCNITTATGW